MFQGCFLQKLVTAEGFIVTQLGLAKKTAHMRDSGIVEAADTATGRGTAVLTKQDEHPPRRSHENSRLVHLHTSAPSLLLFHCNNSVRGGFHFSLST